MKKLALTLAAAALVLGSMALSANAQGAGAASMHALSPERDPDRQARGLSRFRPLLRAGNDPGVRPVPLLVPALLLIGHQAMSGCEAALGRPRCFQPGPARRNFRIRREISGGLRR